MRASRGMGAMNPSKMPKGVKKARRDDTDFTEFKEGGLAQQAATATAMKAAGKKPKKMAGGQRVGDIGTRFGDYSLVGAQPCRHRGDCAR